MCSLASRSDLPATFGLTEGCNQDFGENNLSTYSIRQPCSMTYISTEPPGQPGTIPSLLRTTRRSTDPSRIEMNEVGPLGILGPYVPMPSDFEVKSNPDPPPLMNFSKSL